jgi:UPF0755 protein
MAKKKVAKSNSKSKPSGFFRKVLISLLFLIVIVGGGTAYYTYTRVYQPNVDTAGKEQTYVFIKTGSNFEDVLINLEQNHIIKNSSSFQWVAERKGYKNKVRPGKYKIRRNMSNNELVNLLRSGVQEPVKLVFNEARTKSDFIEVIHKQIDADKDELNKLINDDSYLSDLGLNSKNVLTLFIPNTYEFYWNTSAKQFIERMAKENEKFWTKNRIQKAQQLGLSKAEVSTLASIVQQESRVVDEQPIIAGVYLNRLKKGMRLQADPTVIFAIGDFTIKRVLNMHLEYDSPYNTYKYAGLPPGPICMPYSTTIDAVLNRKQHNYVYFCAKEDFSGRHNFAANIAEHDRNAAKFRKALNARKIFK